MKIADKAAVGFLLILIGASLQNITWFFRLQRPEMLREFEMYWAADGVRLFLDFNVINYFFIFILVVIMIIFKLLDRRSSSVQITSQEDLE